MFESRHRSSGGNSANRWLIVAGAGLVILAFVARMLLDIGHTKVSDLAGVLRPDTATAASAATAPVDTVLAPPVPDSAATVTPAPPSPEAQATAPTASVPTTSAPTAPPPPAAAPAPAAPGGQYLIQIGAFGSEANAARLVQGASALGYQASVIPQARDGSNLYLVRVAGTGSAADARVASDSLARTLGVKAVVLRPGH